MMKFFLTGASIFAMTAGVALAQTTSETVTTTTTVPAAPVITTVTPGSYSTVKTQKTIDSTGAQVEKSQVYNSTVNGTTASTTVQAVAPDGSQKSISHEEQTVGPHGESTTSRTISTTTTR